MNKEDYKKRYKAVFSTDIGLSRKFMPDAIEVVASINLPKEVRDNEGTKLDRKGYDLTIKPIQIGVRVRRFYAIRYDQFTQDDKERLTMSCDFYFLGYATRNEEELYSYIVFDGKDYERKRNAGEIPIAKRMRNETHSSVWFNCYGIGDIKNSCKIYACKGKIGFRRSEKPIAETPYIEHCVIPDAKDSDDIWQQIGLPGMQGVFANYD